MHQSIQAARRAVALGVVILATGFGRDATADLSAQPVITNFEAPTRLVAPAGDDRLFAVSQSGRIEVYDQSGQRLAVFLDLSSEISFGGERGLLGLAFAPDYAQSGRFYVDYTNTDGDTRVVRYTVSADPNVADANSASPVLNVAQPYTNHNGGCLQFGPDGMLYVGLGDGGSGGDPQNRAQNLDVMLGKLLRLDVSGAVGYTVPPDNPLVGRAGLDEIWAYGLRNPWCFSFDSLTGDLYIADVGQYTREEIDVQRANTRGGANYGWRLMEGTACYDPPTDCNDGTLVLPDYDYTHGGSPFRCAISGGYVYRGERIPALSGQYFFADYCSGQVWSAAWSPQAGFGPVTDWSDQLTPPGGFGGIASIGQDGHGELYVCDNGGSAIYRIVGAAVEVDSVPDLIALGQNAPNPFNPRTTIPYDVRRGGAHVRLRIYDQAGKLVRTLVDGTSTGGSHEAVWDGTDDRGMVLPDGVYLYRLEQAGRTLARKMVLVK